MRIFVIHNYYQQAGGEDIVFANEQKLLRSHGHEVLTYEADNHEIQTIHPTQAMIETIWSVPVYRKLVQILQSERPDVVHFHNTFMRISPAAYYACQKANVPVVQTLHNFRLLCANATFYRNGSVCETCLHQSIPLAGVRHACYRESRLQSMVVAGLLTTHRLLKTWQQQVNVYIALTAFARQKFIEGGLPADKIRVKPNFIVNDPGQRPQAGQYALFVGRLSAEKGIRLLAEAWGELSEIPLKIVGDGPLYAEIAATLQSQPQNAVEMLGRQDHETILALMKGAAFLVLPSECYEGFPMTIAEAYACGLPILAANHGAMAESVHHGKTGLHFMPGDAGDLVRQVRWAWQHPAEMSTMGEHARAQYEQCYTAERNYAQLIQIYQDAIAA